MDAIVPEGEAEGVVVDCKCSIVPMSHLNNLFLLSNSSNFYMDIFGKVLYIHNRHLPSPL
jgi:hypothetical protein